ncbi:hypothetical protein Pta02_29420 [Planobispora takensis]|uniref:Uncharacterized protein n=1 Tax=Planobispora takensis TaxID=1367882 RepID=A0A8J3T4N9_9ACTN|nr:hypothetical protein Pta02_29420 [Planobispora takensis]
MVVLCGQVFRPAVSAGLWCIQASGLMNEAVTETAGRNSHPHSATMSPTTTDRSRPPYERRRPPPSDASPYRRRALA